MTDACSICLEPLNDNVFTTKCNHTFHTNCLVKLSPTSELCPNCRQELTQYTYTVYSPPTNEPLSVSLNVPHISIHMFEQVLQELSPLQMLVYPKVNNQDNIIHGETIQLLPTQLLVSVSSVCRNSFDLFVDLQKATGIITYNLPTIHIEFPSKYREAFRGICIENERDRIARIIYEDDIVQIIQTVKPDCLGRYCFNGASCQSRHFAFYSNGSIGGLVSPIIYGIDFNFLDVPLIPTHDAVKLTTFITYRDLTWTKIDDTHYKIFGKYDNITESEELTINNMARGIFH